jgi:DNA-binding transcriptional MocR family regulator
MTISLPIIQTPIPLDFIDLGVGEPALASLPVDLLHQAAEMCFDQNDPSFLQYGLELGNGYFRQALADFLSQGCRLPTDPATLLVTNGSSMGLHLVCSLFTSPGDVVFVEEPTYFLALRILADHDLQIIPIQTDRDGLVVDCIEEKIKTYHPKFVYVIPTFQNPTGRTLSLQRRAQLVSLSRKHDFIVVADEIYQFLNYRCQSPEPFGASIDEGPIISLNSFSKILAPGLRLGWLQSNPVTLQRFVTSGLLDSGGGLNPFTSAMVRFVIESGGLAANIDRLKAEYGSRLLDMDVSLRRHLPSAEYVPPQGGYFFWLRFPGVDTLAWQKKARSFKVGFSPGPRFSCQPGLLDFIRLSFVHYSSAEIEEGLIRLKESLAEFRSGT